VVWRVQKISRLYLGVVSFLEGEHPRINHSVVSFLEGEHPRINHMVGILLEKIGGGRELELLQTHFACCFSICSCSTSLCLMLLLLGQDISCSYKYTHQACDRTSLTTTSPSKKTMAKIRCARVSCSERRTITKRAKM
jgi:hypothetical protein